MIETSRYGPRGRSVLYNIYHISPAQKILKEEAENPSGPGVFELGIEKMKFLMSLSSGMEINLSFSSSVTRITPISLARNLGLSNLYRL